MMNAEQSASVLIHLMEDDPTKIVEAIDDANAMISAGADFGMSRHALMAEYVMETFKKQNANNPHTTDMVAGMIAHEAEIDRILIAHFENKGW